MSVSRGQTAGNELVKSEGSVVVHSVRSGRGCELDRKVRSRVGAVAAAFLVFAVLVSACSRAARIIDVGEDARTPGVESPGVTSERTITVGLAEAPSTLDPADHRARQSETVIRNMFDGLVTRDTLSGVHLELAEEMTWLDEQTLQVRLRRGVLFHDGSEMTAEDVVFTFERIIMENGIEYPDPHTSPRKGLISPLESIERTDDYTVVMHFAGPWPPAMQMLVHQQIVPKHYLLEVGTRGFIEHPVGTGPFKFARASADLHEIVLERFDDYYGGAPDLAPAGRACADRVTFRVIPDALTRAAALRAGEVDIIQAVPQNLVEDLAESPTVRVLSVPGTRPAWVDMNVGLSPFDDVRVRLALNHAVDKERLIEEVYDSRAHALPGPLSPFNNFVSDALEPYAYDPEEALRLLAEADWIDSDDDGVLDRGGSPLSLTIDTLEVWRPLAGALADQLREIGIEVALRFWERSVIGPRMLAGERMAYLDGWGDSAFDPVGHFEAKWHAFVEGQPYGRGNYSGYDNQRVNELIRAGEVTADPARRHMIYDEAQSIIYQDAPAVFLIVPDQIEAASARLLNWEPAADGRINLHDVCVAEEGGP